MRAPAFASASVLALVALSACGGVPGPGGSVPPAPGTHQSASSPPRTAAASAHAYFTGLASNDPTQEADAVGDAASGSLAAAYAQHLANVDDARTDAGDTEDPEDLTEDEGVYGYCPGADTESDDCLQWGDVTFSGGKVAAFSVNGKSLHNRLTVGSGDTIKAGRLAQVTFLSAYQSVQSNSVWVTFRVRTGSKKVTFASYDATYRSPDGRQSTASDSGGPFDIDKDSTATIYSVFKRAKPGGVVKLQVFDAHTFEGPTLEVRTR